MNNSTKSKGNEGEDLAVEYLLKKGFEIIERNYRYGKGEIDIIALDKNTSQTVFVEVKLRKNYEFGDPIYSITKNKIRQLKKIAELYLFDKNITEINCRFDVITILKFNKTKSEIKHYINAFT